MEQEKQMIQTLENYKIDYNLLNTVRTFYDRFGFTYMEVPWMVDKDYSLITTTPEGAFATKPSQHLLGSAEQSFLKLALTGRVAPSVRFQAITPCFRRDIPDESHSRWFMKLELFEYFNHPIHDPCVVDLELGYFRSRAYECFKVIINTKSHQLQELAINDGFDIYLNGIEIGSYGIRHYKNMTWVYGTGLALPRFSYALCQ